MPEDSINTASDNFLENIERSLLYEKKNLSKPDKSKALFSGGFLAWTSEGSGGTLLQPCT